MIKVGRVLVYFFLFSFVSFHGICEIPSPDLTINIPMRDGALLPAHVYLPQKDACNLPCILLRNPAGKESDTAVCYADLAKLGYAVVIQDGRNLLDKGGKAIPYATDGWGCLQDGYDTVAWLSKSPLTNGKIGTLGTSSMGISQLLLAPTAPPGLACQYISMASSNLYEDAIFVGGQFLKNQVEGWLNLYAAHPQIYQTVRAQSAYNEFWSSFNTLPQASKVTAPALFITGWYDTFLQGSINSFVSRQNEGGVGARGKQRLLIGPWTHRFPMVQTLGEFQIPEKGREAPYDLSPAKWFDYHLKGTLNGIEKMPTVTYYVMGPFDGTASSGNTWKTADVWPVPSKPTPFYLAANQKLKETAPSTNNSFSYDYDPKEPTPTIGGHNLFLEAGVYDQRSLEKRSDVVFFTSEPLKEDLEITGRLLANIQFSTDQEDTDLVVRLTDVYPDGKNLLIAEGITRLAPYCLKKGSLAVANTIHDVLVDLWSTSIVFAKGHKIGLMISSASYPRFDKNPNLGLNVDPKSEPKVAHNQIHIGKSSITLPVVRT